MTLRTKQNNGDSCSNPDSINLSDVEITPVTHSVDQALSEEYGGRNGTQVAPLSPEMVALAKAYKLMQKLRFTSNLPEDVRRELTFCQRHFPNMLMYTAEYWHTADGSGK